MYVWITHIIKTVSVVQVQLRFKVRCTKELTQESSFQQLCGCPVYRAKSQSQLAYSRMFEFPCYSLH